MVLKLSSKDLLHDVEMLKEFFRMCDIRENTILES